MTGKYADDNKRLKTAIDHALNGRRLAADAELAAVAGKSPDRRFRLWQALAETAIWPLRHRPAGGPLYGLKAFAGLPDVDVDEAPPALQLATRFIATQAVHDVPQLQALYLAAHDTGQHQVMAEAQGLLLAAAVESARAQLANKPGQQEQR